MSTDRTLTVQAIWDDEARVRVATSDDVPGLAAEGGDMEVLVKKLRSMNPGLLDAHGVAHGVVAPFEIVGQRFAVAHREAA